MQTEDSTAASEDRLGDDFLDLLREQRAQAETLLAEQQGHLEQLEAELLAVVTELSEQLACEQDETTNARSEWRAKATDLERQANDLTRLKQELTAQQTHWSKLQDLQDQQQQVLLEQVSTERAELESRTATLDEREQTLNQLAAGLQDAEAKLDELRRAAEQAQQAAQEELESSERRNQRLQEREARLDEAIQQAEDHDAETRRQRRRLANQFREQREEFSQLQEKAEQAWQSRQQEMESRQQELESLTVAEGDQGAQLEAIRQQRDELREQVAGGEQELNDLNDRLAALAEQVALLSEANAELQNQDDALDTTGQQEQIAALQAENEQLRRASSGQVPDEALSAELDQFSREKNELIHRLMAADEKIHLLENQPQSDDSESFEKLAEMKRRIEMAIEDNRELKRRNADLEEQLASGVSAAPDDDTCFDWESQKQRLIASLESDFDPNDEQQQMEKLTAEGTIRITDEIVTRKEREIAELKQLLEDQSSNLGNMAVGAAAVQQVLDTDDLIREERQNLKQMKESWREKQRKAEVEISLERAKIARMRAEFEEKLSHLEMNRAAHGDTNAEQVEALPRGRWLTRLGLKDDDQQ